MYIEMVPTIPNAKVVNQEIVYNDTPVEVEKNANNLQVYSISKVSKYSLDACIRIILESNPDVVFNTIQYSKSNNIVYFYTDRPISTKAWEDRKNRPLEKINNNQDVLREIKNVLAQEVNKDSDCISLYSIALLAKKYEEAYKSIKKEYEKYCNKKLEEKNAEVSIYDFDKDNNRLHISYNHYKR